MLTENGDVLLEHPGDGLVWIEAPPFTAELRYAESLLPEGLCTFYRDARKVCATALQERALANEPPLPSSLQHYEVARRLSCRCPRQFAEPGLPR